MISSTALAMLDLLARAGPSSSACQNRPRCIFRVRPVMMLSSVDHALEQRDVLEGARDALRGGLVRAHAWRASRP